MMNLKKSDPRNLQLLVLSGLLLYGKINLTFFPDWITIFLIGVCALSLQFLSCTVFQVRFDPKSTLISSLSLALLLRFSALEPVLWAVAIVVLGKFLIRSNNRHIYNPTNLAVVAVSWLFSDSAWISGGQWGNGIIFGFFLAALGIAVVTGVKRWDISFSTLAIWTSILLVRATYYGDPIEVPFHTLTNSGLILFCFFMISDPKTSPDSRLGRMLFSLGVCIIGSVVQFYFYKPHGLFYGLFLMSSLYPFLNVFRQGEAYNWPKTEYLKRKTGDLA
jgi:enediyne biosynthesis protein E5